VINNVKAHTSAVTEKVFQQTQPLAYVAAWLSGIVLVSINKVTLCRAQLVLEWATVYGWVHHLDL